MTLGEFNALAIAFSAIGTLALAFVAFWSIRTARQDRINENKRYICSELYNWLKRASIIMNTIRNSDGTEWFRSIRPSLNYIISESDSINVLQEDIGNSAIKKDFENLINSLRKIEPILQFMVWERGSLVQFTQLDHLKVEEYINSLMVRVLEAKSKLS